jgi:hypothetical protein
MPNTSEDANTSVKKGNGQSGVIAIGVAGDVSIGDIHVKAA